MKDNFSLQANEYSRFRPTYPKTLYEFLFSLTGATQTAWDCGTGNGQVAQELAKHFAQVIGTDISAKQIKSAVKAGNIIYKIESAEKTSLPDNSIDLVTVAQAIHWFNFDLFYDEVKRVARPGAIIAVIGYALISIDEATDKVIDHFYRTITGPYWDKERKYIDEHYQTIPFPFEEIKSPVLEISFDWTLAELVGYLGTWSAVQHFKTINKSNPVDMIEDALQQSWGNSETKKIKFPILLRTGKIK